MTVRYGAQDTAGEISAAVIVRTSPGTFGVTVAEWEHPSQAAKRTSMKVSYWKVSQQQAQPTPLALPVYRFPSEHIRTSKVCCAYRAGHDCGAGIRIVSTIPVLIGYSHVSGDESRLEDRSHTSTTHCCQHHW